MGTLVCRIELDKQNGVTVLVENEEGQTTQKVTMDGTTLKLEVQGSSDTSTFVQDAESITITCKNFTVDSEILALRSSGASTWSSEDTLEVTSTSDMSLQTDAGLTIAAASDTALSSDTNIAVSAASELSMEATNVAVAGQAEVKVEGATLALSGTAQMEAKAPMVKIEASGKLDLESSGLANLKGSLTSVSGQLVKVG